MSLTQQQQRAVEARGKVIVSASAGSGKTRVMIERFVSIIARGEADVTELLAVTFTNKAAQQMRDRARQKLTEAYRAASPNDRPRLAEQLKDLPIADISTIHAFCGKLVRTYFYLVGVDPRFQIVDGEHAEGKALSARALDAAFEQAYEEGGAWFGELLSAYFRKKKDKRLREIVKTLYDSVRNLAGYGALLEAYAEGGDVAWDLDAASDAPSFLKEVGRDAAKKELSAVLSFLEGEYRGRAEEIEGRAKGILPLVSQAAPGGLTALNAIAAAAEEVGRAPDLFAMREAARALALPRNPARTARSSAETAYAIGQVQALSKQLKELCGEIAERAAGWREEFARYLDGRKRASALARLLLLYDEAYSRAKREAGALDYGDLEHLALEVLKNDEARSAVRARYRYVFVDEFQDVNSMQNAILEAVSGEEQFLVGDKKQAIYGFRGSRSRFFTERERALGGGLALDCNFRCSPAVLDAVNRVFAAAMPDYVPMQGGEGYGEHRGEVFFHTAESEKGEKEPRGVYSVVSARERSTENAAAREVLSLIEEECGRRGEFGKQWFDSEKGEMREVGYGDIAVLVRKNSGIAGAVVRLLSERGIPVTATAEVNICDFFEVRLLIDWLSFLDNAEQDIPLASAMLSALGGFEERELALIRLKTERTLKRYKLTFRAACRAYIEGYREGNDPLCRKMEAFFARAETYRTFAQVKSAPEMLSLLLADGLEAQIAAKGDVKNRLARVRRLLSESADCPSAHAFLKRLAAAEYRVDFSESGGEGAVRVITMHASKGLEFPVVILTELDVPFHGATKDETMWTDEFKIAPKSFDFETKTFYETLARRAAEAEMEREETEGERNLLYVGMTRARYRLHMVFDRAAEIGGAADVRYLPARARRLSDFIPRGDMADLEAPNAPLEEGAAERHMLAYRSDPALLEAIKRAALPYAFEGATAIPVKDSATNLMKRAHAQTYRAIEEDERLISDMDSPHSVEEGLAYHAFLEHVRFGEGAEEELSRMRREGILSKEEIALLDPARLEAILHMPCLCSLKEKHILREQKFLVLLPACDFEEIYKTDSNEEILFQGALDLLVFDGEGCHIIDYKYSSRNDADLKEHYAPQIKLYRKAVAKILKVKESAVRATLVNIALGREVPL